MNARHPLRVVTLERQTSPARRPDPALVRILADLVDQAMSKERQTS